MAKTANTVLLANHRVKEGLLILTAAFATYLLLALLSYHQNDPGWSHFTTVTSVYNVGGRAGAWIADMFLYLFGVMSYGIPTFLFYSAWVLARNIKLPLAADTRLWWLRTFGFVFVLFSGCGLSALHFSGLNGMTPIGAGGVLGSFVGFGMAQSFSFVGSTLILLAVALSGITLLTGLSWLHLMDICGEYSLIGFAKLTKQIQALQPYFKKMGKRFLFPVEAEVVKTPIVRKKEPPRLPHKVTTEYVQKQQKAPMPLPAFIEEPNEEAFALIPGAKRSELPALSLLDPAESRDQNNFSNDALEQMSRTVEAKLQDFGIYAQVVAVHPGPVITRYEIQLAPGIKAGKVTALAKDLARSMSVVSVRVVEVIPGKSVIGLELPNESRNVVQLSEVISSEAYQQTKSPLALALGKDISGHPVVVDLAKMPHLLVAGTTGSGKSVGINAMLLSLLYKATADQVRLILIDPKMLELSCYAGIPHLLTPVVTDMKDAANALRWSVAEMERRYRLMAALGVRNLAGYNVKIHESLQKGTPVLDPLWNPQIGAEPAVLDPLPFIVVVIDEFADMMMMVGKKVEELIARLAQKARAAGIHLILATQRPSVDVITGLIKANVPTRIAFQVSSKIDSRTILDQHGAEQLLGYGDMLYMAPGTGIPVRVHGAYVSDLEVFRVANELKKMGKPVYIESITAEHEGNDPSAGDIDPEEADELYDQAVKIVLDTRRATISSLQRRLKIGYNRAARLIEAMEKAGLVSSMESNGNREILVPEADHS